MAYTLVPTELIQDGAVTSAKLDTNIAISGTVSAGGVVTANSGVVIDNITIDGNQIAISTGDLILDAAGDIILDADGTDIVFKDGGTQFGKISNASTHVTIYDGTTLNTTMSGANITFAGTVGSGAITSSGLITATSLDISGDVDIDGTTNLDVVDIDGAVDMASTLTMSAGGTISAGGANDLVLNAGASGTPDIYLQSGGGTKVKIEGSDNTVTIGLNNSSSSNLTLYGATSAESQIFFGNDGTNGNKDGAIRYFHEAHGTTANRRSMTFSTANTERMRVNATGVGIGVSPSHPLHITKEIAGYQAYFNNDNGSAQGVKVRVKANDSGNFNMLELVSASTGSDVTAMIVRDDGNVGILKTAPTANLHIGTSGADSTRTLRIDGTNGSSQTMGFILEVDGENSRVGFKVGTSNGTPAQKLMIHPDGGICFGTDTAAANALDDYEEGTWTPASTATAFQQAYGTYTKVGNIVNAWFAVQVASSINANFFQLNGLPFSYSNTVGGMSGGSMGLTDMNTNEFTLYVTGSAILLLNLTNDGYLRYNTYANKFLRGHVVYRTS